MITGYVFDGIKGFNVPNYVFENLVTRFSLFAPSIERRIFVAFRDILSAAFANTIGAWSLSPAKRPW